MPALLGLLLLIASLSIATASAADVEPLIFLSTQLRPIEEAQKMRNVILKDFPRAVDYMTEQPRQLAARVSNENRHRAQATSVVGALHGELQPLMSQGALVPLDDLIGKLTTSRIPTPLLKLSKFDTKNQYYIPWMQASYIMVANKAALPYLPSGADINALSYDQLATWAAALYENTGKRLLGFPAGPQGLMHRFFEGSLLPSYTGGVVVPFRSEEAETMWTQFALLWKSVNPNSTSYNFMQEPLLSGEVWIGFDHVARLLNVLRQKPNDFVAFPVPAGPKGRGYMSVLAGLALLRGGPDVNGAMTLIDYLIQPRTQTETTRSIGFFPVTKIELPSDFDASLKLAIDAVDKTQAAEDALLTLPPSGLGSRSADFDKILIDTFQLVVLLHHKPRSVLDSKAATLQLLMTETGASCWQPDPPSIGVCQVQ